MAKENAGELDQASKLFTELLPKQQEVLGDHPDTQETQGRIDKLKASLTWTN
jgi:hypothetical protein